MQDNLLIFSIIELCILGVFVLEIILSSYAWGIKTYFKDRWLVLDAIIICLSVVFVLIELSVQMSKIAGNIISIAQAIFRFLRIFLLIRKAQTFKKFKTSAVKTPAEKIIDFLYELKEIVDDDIDTLLDLDYCIDKIASN